MKQSMLPHSPINRRDFLRWVTLTGGAFAFAGCQGKTTMAPEALPSLTPGLAPTASPTNSPTVPLPTSIPVTPTAIPRSAVGIGKTQSYDPKVIRSTLESLLDSLGGIGDLVKPGARVGIKVNMTGSSIWDTPEKPPANEYFVTHPQVAATLAELVIDAGASQVYFMDGIAEEACFEKWGFSAVAKPLGVRLINLNRPDPNKGYASYPVGNAPFVYDRFDLHPVLGEIDLLISAAKMKVHSAAGVTLSLKNLIGLAAIDQYVRHSGDTFRSAFHGAYQFDTRLTRVILDLNQACPIHLAIIDGVVTCEGGAGPWDATLHQVRPGVLLAGRDPVATDAVATVVMGFNPGAASGDLPFVRCENYLEMANGLGMGTNQLNEIPILGESIEGVRFPFQPTR
ncbi:MAG: DUF362 domain-containing protein [Anaerolineaceae bacterium]|nr:DUF362 domain-containing protein [Anaerolineaceae bacterium]